jgi:hypothetical protein
MKMPPQYIFVSNYKTNGGLNVRPNETVDNKNFTLSSISFFSGIICINELIRKFSNNFNNNNYNNNYNNNFNNNNTPDNFKSYASYKINNSPCEEWRNELNKCYGLMKQCNHLDIIELQNKLEKCNN